MASFCEISDVKEKLESFKGKGFADTDITKRIIRATNFLKSKLLTVYGASVVSGWDSSTPGMVKDLCAGLAAAYIKMDFISDYRTSTTEKETIFGLLASIIKGEGELFDDDGAVIARSGNKTKCSTSGIIRDFTAYHPDHSDFGQGSLDDYGVTTVSSDDYPGEDA